MGLDGIFEVSSLYPRGRRLGYVDRRRGAPVQFIEPVSESIQAEARRLVDERDYAELPEEFKAATAVREVWLAPPPPPSDDIEDDE